MDLRWWEWLLIAIPIVGVVFAFRHWQRVQAELSEGELVASVGVFEVRVTYHDGQGIVRFSNPGAGIERIPLHAGLTPAQARQLAQWLRIAAARGKTLADARRNASQRPSAPTTAA